MPFTADKADRQLSTPIGLVPLRDALSRYRNGSVLVVSPDGGEVHLVPLRQALQERAEGSVVVFGGRPAAEGVSRR
jgi:hypothetical protein